MSERVVRINDSGRPYKIIQHKEETIGRVTVVYDTIEINGKHYPYSYTSIEDCSVILPITGANIVLIKQYRHTMNDWMWEIPAGGVANNTPFDAAKRELLEETGYQTDRLVHLGTMPISQGTSTTLANLYVSFCHKEKAQQLDETELIEVHEIPIQRFEEMIKTHEFNHMVAIAAWYMYKISLQMEGADES